MGFTSARSSRHLVPPNGSSIVMQAMTGTAAIFLACRLTQ